MTIQECYQEMGGNFAEVSGRLPSAKLIERFALRFLDDPSYADLCKAMEAGNREEAFRAAHTLKGVSANLSFTQLLNSAHALTELLRPQNPEIPQGADALMANVRRDYETTVSAINKYKGTSD